MYIYNNIRNNLKMIEAGTFTRELLLTRGKTRGKIASFEKYKYE